MASRCFHRELEEHDNDNCPAGKDLEKSYGRFFFTEL